MFKLNLFDSEVESYESSDMNNQPQDSSAVNIDLQSSRKRGDIDKIISEMTIPREESEEEDLLALMDKAA